MFPATLIISSSAPAVQKKIKIICQKLQNPFHPNNPDILKIGESSWTIKEVRQLRHFFSQKPFSHTNKIAIIFNAEKMGPPAQNALLKTLEEPGPNNFLILTTAKPQALLPTILSRCQSFRPHHPSERQSRPNIGTIRSPPPPTIPLTSDPIKNLAVATGLSADKNSIPPLLSQELRLQQQILVRHPDSSTAKKITKLIHSLRLIKHNVDPRSALDYYVLSTSLSV